MNDNVKELFTRSEPDLKSCVLLQYLRSVAHHRSINQQRKDKNRACSNSVQQACFASVFILFNIDSPEKADCGGGEADSVWQVPHPTDQPSGETLPHCQQPAHQWAAASGEAAERMGSAPCQRWVGMKICYPCLSSLSSAFVFLSFSCFEIPSNSMEAIRSCLKLIILENCLGVNQLMKKRVLLI